MKIRGETQRHRRTNLMVYLGIVLPEGEEVKGQGK